MENQEKNNFGDWVRREREQKGLNQTELAAAIGVSAGSISAIESGKARSVGRKMVTKLQNYFSGKGACILSHNNHSSIQLLENPKTNNVVGEECLSTVIRQLSSIAIRDDFKERVAKVADALNCSEDEAAFTIFSMELKKITNY